MTQRPTHLRFLARHLVDGAGVEHPLAVAIVNPATREVVIEPFEMETAATAMVDGLIEVTAGGLLNRLPDGTEKWLVKFE